MTLAPHTWTFVGANIRCPRGPTAGENCHRLQRAPSSACSRRKICPEGSRSMRWYASVAGWTKNYDEKRTNSRPPSGSRKMRSQTRVKTMARGHTKETKRVIRTKKSRSVTLNQAMTMVNRASILRLKCCAERCLHSLEQQQPGWIARKRRELLSMRKNRKNSQRTRIALRALRVRGSRRQRSEIGGVPQCAAYMKLFLEIDELLRERSACTASGFAFFRKLSFMGNPVRKKGMLRRAGRHIRVVPPSRQKLWRLWK